MKTDFDNKIVTFKTVFESEVLNQTSKSSVEYEQYIDEIYKWRWVFNNKSRLIQGSSVTNEIFLFSNKMPTVKTSPNMNDGTVMDEK